MSGFKHGRTECVRGMTVASVEFCKSTASSKCLVLIVYEWSCIIAQFMRNFLEKYVALYTAYNANDVERSRMMNIALNMHRKNTKCCANGQGFDRHLLVCITYARFMQHFYLNKLMPNFNFPTFRACDY